MFSSMSIYKVIFLLLFIAVPSLLFGNGEDQYLGLEDLKDITVEIPLSVENPKETLTVTLDSLINPIHQSRLAKIQNDLKKERKVSRGRMESARFIFSVIVVIALDDLLIKKRFKNWRKIRITFGIANLFLSWLLSDWIFNYGDRVTGATEYFINDMTESKINEGLDLYSGLLEIYSDADNGDLESDDFKKLIEKSFKNPFLNQLMRNIIADSGIYSVDSNLINQDIDFQSQYNTNLLLESYFIDKNFSQDISTSSLVNTYPGIRYLPYASVPLHAYLKKRNLSFLIPPSLEELKPFPMLGQFGRETVALMALMYFPELMEDEDSFSLVPILSSVALSYATSRVALAGVSRLIKAYKVFRAGSKAAAVGEAATGPLGWKVFILNQLAVITASMLLEGPITQWYTKRKIWLALQDTRSIFYTFLHDPLLDPWVVNATVSTFYQLLNEYRRLVLQDTFDKDNELLEEGRKEEMRIDIMEENMRRIRTFLADDLWQSKPYYELVEDGPKFDIFVETHKLSEDIGIKMPVPIKEKHICIFHKIENTCTSSLPITHYEPECFGDSIFYDIVMNGLPQPEINELIAEFDNEESTAQSDKISDKKISLVTLSAIKEYIQSELAAKKLRNSIKVDCRDNHHKIDSSFREHNKNSNLELKIDFSSISEGIETTDGLRKSRQEEYNKTVTSTKRQYLVAVLQTFEEEHLKKTIKASVAIKDAYYGLDVARRDFIREQCKDLQKIDPRRINIKDSFYPPSMVYSAPLVNSSYQDTLIAGFAFAKYLEKTFSEFDTKGNSWHWLVERETKHIESLNKLCEKIPIINLDSR